MKRLTKLFSILTIVSLGLLLVVSPALAIDLPDDLQINSVYAFQHCIENNDQLYLVQYFIDYDPDDDPLTDDNPAENISDAYLCRFMDGVDELKSIAPYAYYDDGYDEGRIALYFAPDDPNLPVWEGAYSIQLTGNPTLDWGGDPPSTAVSTFDLWSSSTSIVETQTELTSRILYMADQLEMDWGINMVDTTSTGSYLSDYGASYFISAVSNIQVMAPRAFAGGTSTPEWEYKEPATTYAEDRASSLDGTPLDLTALSDWWGIGRMWASSLLFMLGGIFILYSILSRSGNYRALSLLSAPLVIAGGYLGALPMQLTVLLGFAAFFLTLFSLFYHPSGA